jgi:hypothetical protein
LPQEVDTPDLPEIRGDAQTLYFGDVDDNTSGLALGFRGFQPRVAAEIIALHVRSLVGDGVAVQINVARSRRDAPARAGIERREAGCHEAFII